MISTAKLLASLHEGHVAFDTQGNPVEVDRSYVRGPASILVAPVADAVKRLRDGVVESLDRDEMWVVEAMVLEGDVLRDLGEVDLTADELWAAVEEAGYAWEVSPTSSL
jgi:hypothetical protein